MTAARDPKDVALSEVRFAAEGLANERASVARLEARLEDRIVKAAKAGVSLRQMEDAAGLKKSQIHRIIVAARWPQDQGGQG